MLSVEDLRAGYGDAVVLDGVGFQLAEHGRLAILGRNGVGKSTLLLTLMGFTRLHKGRLLWKGQDISREAPHRRARLGLGWVALEREIFPSLTVGENLTVAARPGRWSLDSVYRLFPRLGERKTHLGRQLSGGEQQMLAVARTLMTNPALLLLDEPLEGLAPLIVEELTTSLKAIDGMALILVEQHAEIALSLTERALVLGRGRVAHDTSSAALLSDPAALERHLGLKR